MHFTTAALTLLTATTSLALPAPASNPILLPRASNNGSFTLLATNIDNDSITNQQIHANARGLFINRPTASYCPSSVGPNCPTPGNITALTASGTGSLSMDVVVPGGQAVYVKKDGTIGYTAPHSASMPKGALMDLFVYRSDYGENTFGSLETMGCAERFVACPVKDGSWRVKVKFEGKKVQKGCLNMTIATYVYPEAAAWEYT